MPRNVQPLRLPGSTYVERWLAIVSERVVITERGCWEWQRGRSGGYGVFSFRKKQLYAHRAALESRVGEIPGGMAACHTCDNPPCCNPDHLEVGTPRFNTRCAVERGQLKSTPGERNPNAKLTQAQVDDIRLGLEQGVTGAELARRYDVSRTTISKIKKGERWAA